MDKISELKREIEKTDDLAQKISLQVQLAYDSRFTDPELSLQTAKEAWREAKNENYHELEVRCLISICSFFSSGAYYQDLIQWTQILEDKAKEINSNSAIGRANLFFYAYYNHLNKENIAENHLYKALDHFNRDNNIQGKTSCYISLGNMKFNHGDYDNAFKFYQTALEICPKDRDVLRFTLMQNIASIHIVREEYLDAWKTYQDLLDIIPEQEFDTRALIQLNLGVISMKTSEYDSAIQYFEEAINLTRNINTNTIHVKAYCMKAEVYLKQKKTQKANKIVEIIEDKFPVEEYQELFEDLYVNFIEFYEENNNTLEVEKFKAKIENIKMGLIN